AVTLPICALGVYLGQHFGTRFSHRAEAFGGILLILIGVEIFLTGIF
ncbi:MAG: manganese efflux pump, partial [Clostridia bacterium]|nr:manganese efflux pump [Clostridia bacterium]